MARLSKLLTAAAALPLAAALLLAPTQAEAQWRGGYGHGGYGYGGGYGRGGYGYHRGPGVGAIIGGAALGVGIGALLAAPYYAPPPVVYAPPPAYYAPPAYAYAPPPGYYPSYYR